MLKDSLYIVQKINAGNNSVEALVELNTQHQVFKGHFPSHPILPGACMLQMVKEILETSINRRLQLIKADEIKFLHIIEPANDALLLFSVEFILKEDSFINVVAKIIKADVICFKLKASYRVKLL